MICLQTFIKFGDRVLKSVLTIKSWIIYVLNDLRFKTLMIINNWERDEPQRVSLVLEVVQEGFRPSLKDGTRDREGLQYVRVDGQGVPASSGVND